MIKYVFCQTKCLLKNVAKIKTARFQQLATATSLQTDSLVNLDHLDSNQSISTIILNRAKQKNAFSQKFLDDFNRALTDLTASKSTRVLVIKSAVPGVFCAGADLKERITMSHSEVAAFTNELRGLMSRIFHLDVPVVAAIDGVAFGGGLELALACDIRVASTVAKMGLVEARLAIMPGAGGTVLLPRLINSATAKEMIFTAKIVDGQEAKSLGLVNYAVEQNESGDAAYQRAILIAQEIVPNGPIGVKMAKKSLNRGLETDFEDAMVIEQACYAKLIPTDDRLEGLRAFIEKRSPKYSGK